MNWKKRMAFAGAICGAMGVGAMLGPVASSADTTPSVPVAQVQPNDNTNGSWQGRGMRMGQYFAGAMHNEIAEHLGMTSDELYQARLDGQSLQELAEEKHKSLDDIVSMLNKNKEAQLEQLVKDKVITEEQKEFMQDNMETRTEQAVKNGSVGQRMGGRGMGGRWNNDGNFTPGQGRGAGRGPAWQQSNN